MKSGLLYQLFLLIILCVWSPSGLQAQIYTWKGDVSGNWSDAGNWSTGIIPNNSQAVVLIDNSYIHGSYTVNLPETESTRVASITITPSAGNTITLIIPSINTLVSSNPAAALTADNIIINKGGIFKNSNGANSGLSLIINQQLTINDEGRYIHNTKTRHADIVEKLSAASGTEKGIFEFDNPDAAVTISLSNRTYGTLILNRSTTNCTYTANGSNNVIIRGNLEIQANVVLNTSGFSGGVFQLRGNLIHEGSWRTSASQKIEFNGQATQIISGSTVRFNGNVEINNPAGVVTHTPLFIEDNINATSTNTSLIFTQGLLHTNSWTVTLGSHANITGESSDKYLVGYLQTIRYVGTGSSDFGGMGITIAAGIQDLGNVTVMRHSGQSAVISLQGNSSIARNWDISISGNQPVSGRTITFSWVPADDNGKDLTAAQVWSQSAADRPWVEVGEQQHLPNSNPRTITVSTTSFSRWTVSDVNNPLPAGLVSFKGRSKQGYAELSWVTASGSHKASFVIERSTDAIHFKKIDSVSANKNPQQSNTYLFKDYLVRENSYYRLKQMDTDGKSAYTKPIYLAVGPNNLLSLPVIPNPSAGPVTINFISKEDAYLQFTSVQGQSLLESKGTPEQILQTLNNHLQHTSPGIYIIKVLQNGKYHVCKFIKQ